MNIKHVSRYSLSSLMVLFFYGTYKQRNVGDINERPIELGPQDCTLIFYIYFREDRKFFD